MRLNLLLLYVLVVQLIGSLAGIPECTLLLFGHVPCPAGRAGLPCPQRPPWQDATSLCWQVCDQQPGSVAHMRQSAWPVHSPHNVG